MTNDNNNKKRGGGIFDYKRKISKGSLSAKVEKISLIWEKIYLKLDKGKGHRCGEAPGEGLGAFSFKGFQTMCVMFSKGALLRRPWGA